MPKFFVISDVHGFYKEMYEELNKAGFDPNNEEHWLISCGDSLDRGRQPQEVINYLMSLPRKILVKGNHDDLLMDCISNGYALGHDWSNGTAQTIIDLAPNANTFDVGCAVAYEKVKDFIGSMVNYFETKNHIFVHAFVPLNCHDTFPAWYIHNRKFSKMDNWREATNRQWCDARWGNPFEFAEQGLLPEKTLVFEHWNTSEAWAIAENRSVFGDDAKFDTFYGDGFIAIDACTAHSNQVNVLIIEDDFLTEQN